MFRSLHSDLIQRNMATKGSLLVLTSSFTAVPMCSSTVCLLQASQRTGDSSQPSLYLQALEYSPLLEVVVSN